MAAVTTDYSARVKKHSQDNGHRKRKETGWPKATTGNNQEGVILLPPGACSPNKSPSYSPKKEIDLGETRLALPPACLSVIPEVPMRQQGTERIHDLTI